MTRARDIADAGTKVNYLDNVTANIPADVATTYAPLAGPTFTGTPIVPTASAATNTTQAASTAFVRTEVSNLVDSAPGSLDTLNELAAALGDDASFSTTVTDSIATKLPKSGGTMTGNIVMGDDTSIGIGDSAERIEFDGAGDISVLGANFGIGVNDPDELLELFGGGTEDEFIKARSSNGSYPNAGFDFGMTGAETRLKLYSSAGTENVKINASGDSWFKGGNVGIGVTPPSDMLSSYSNIAFGGNSTLQTNNSATAGASLYISQNAYRDSDPNWRRISDSDEASQYWQNNGTHKFQYVASGSGDITWTTAMSIDSSGNVGIGETAPDCELHIKGDTPRIKLEATTATSTNDAGVIFANQSDVTRYELWHSENDGVFYFDQRVESDGWKFKFRTYPSGGSINTDALVIAGDGKVGIGTTGPGYMLTVAEDRAANWAVSIVNDASDGAGLMVEAGGGSADKVFKCTGGSTEIFTVKGDGKVGIGEASPNALLHIKKPASGVMPAMHLERTGAMNHYIGYDTTNSLIIGENVDMVTTVRVSISSGGAVTIAGSLSKGSGSFKIDHPLESKSLTHNLIHSFIEGPQADLIYRGKVTLVTGSASVNIDTESNMTDGTFSALCRDVQTFTTNETGWIAVKGIINENILTIIANDETCTDSISWMVIGERKDKHMIETEWTDDNGKVIVEPVKVTTLENA